jgi:uncharacterized protein (DUF2249 family)
MQGPAVTDVLEVLAGIPDPELGIGIVDLGLIYDITLGEDSITIVMTMTTPACPLPALLREQIEEALHAQFPALRQIEIQLVWEPPWSPLLMSPKARAMLGWPHTRPIRQEETMNIPAGGQTESVLDVRGLEPRARHPLIFRTFDQLAPGQSFVLVNDHDPKPLYYQMQFERKGQFDWQYLEEGPEVWRVRITRMQP